MKYVVKNCMCAYGFVNEPMYCLWKDEVPIHKTLCADCTDCVMKQIVEECKKAKNIDYVYQRDKLTGEAISVSSYVNSPNYEFADKLLQLLHIENVE